MARSKIFPTKSGIDRIAFTKGVTAADYDNDGYVDFYVSNLNGNNFLYHNNHDGTFTEVAQEAGVQKPWQSFAAWFFDYDNDGWPDLFVASYYISVDESIRSYLGLPRNAETLKLYRNMGDGTFRDVTAEVGLDRVFMPMGANFGDSTTTASWTFISARATHPTGRCSRTRCFITTRANLSSDITASSGTGELHKGHGVAFADLANNGHEDILVEDGRRRAGRSARLPPLREPRQWQRLDHPALGRCEDRTARRLARESR